MESPFDVLGVDPGADEEEIVQAYRRRAKETHPDQGGSAREFQLVTAAYEEIVSRRRGDELDSGREARGERPGPTESMVEFLNYELLDDYGWDLDDEDLFEKAAAEDLDPDDHGRIVVEPGETLLEGAENRGYTWPYSCRGGACANCAVAVMDGELSMPVDHILTPELLDRGIRLSCVGAPTTGEMQVVYNVKHLPAVEELLLPPGPFRGKADD